ncbi:MAG: hypothetical protein NXY57DRAFT_991051 [Lentinula lateritia]|uniref:Uncharacterized protein n=1 Tax=Lentinula lateritia TaxID=40482 RepID=A0ABQ8VR78_9AGAR|nr:hypothetical protein EV359DRAFT_79711 [Lentinula novae-zelandiae]KAJ3935209.1 MAG: hypothetical protein NXY57DRAFT_991051 [Lentinula lateritia]KAJ4498898.1 hypothetical protein C8R41DRAFT_978652 [Lentinula lateritia]
MSSFLNKLTGTTNSSVNSSGGMTDTSANGGMSGSNQNEDYGDKALDFIEKKTGHTLGRDTNEKITDGVRNQYEKMSGKTVPSKVSN